MFRDCPVRKTIRPESPEPILREVRGDGGGGILVERIGMNFNMSAISRCRSRGSWRVFLLGKGWQSKQIASPIRGQD